MLHYSFLLGFPETGIGDKVGVAAAWGDALLVSLLIRVGGPMAFFRAAGYGVATTTPGTGVCVFLCFTRGRQLTVCSSG